MDVCCKHVAPNIQDLDSGHPPVRLACHLNDSYSPGPSIQFGEVDAQKDHE